MLAEDVGYVLVFMPVTVAGALVMPPGPPQPIGARGAWRWARRPSRAAPRFPVGWAVNTDSSWTGEFVCSRLNEAATPYKIQLYRTPCPLAETHQ